jgi:tetratricopeptide (TPR) repeat protein
MEMLMRVRFNRSLTALLLLGLSSCAVTPPPPEQEPVSPTMAEQPSATLAAKPELTADLMFKLLVAEFAAQEGQLSLSAEAYLRSAEETREPQLARRATQAAIYAHDINTALAAATLWVELDPNEIDARQSVGAILIRSGHNKEAMPHLRKIVELTDKNERAKSFHILARQLVHSRDAAQALQQMQELTAPYRNSPSALYSTAWLANQLGKNETARELLRQLLKKEPKNSEALILQARVMHGLGHDDKAVDSLHRALTLDPENDQMRLTYARMLIDTKKLKQARQEFRKLNQRLPDNSDVIYALGLLAMDAGDTEDAEPYFMDLLRLNERVDEARFALGQLAQQRKQTDEAIKWYQSVPQGERYLEAQSQAAQLIAQEKGVDQALAYLRKLNLITAEDKIQRYQAEAQLLASSMRLNDAMAIYDEALNHYPDNADLLYARALIAESIGRIDLLERDLKRILHKDPNNVQALNALGYTLADRTDRHEEAFGYIKQAYKLRSNDPAILDSMGWGLYHLGRLDEALEYLRRAADMLRDAEISAHLGEVLWASGKHKEAKKVWDEAIKLEPEHRILKETIQRLNP